MKLSSFLTGLDDMGFCKRVSDKLNNAGWELYGNPGLTLNGKTVFAGQEVTKEVEGTFHHEIDMKKM